MPEPTGELALPLSVAAPRDARRYLARQLADGRLPEPVVQDVLVCTSELVANAILHAETEAKLVVQELDDGVRVEVADGASVRPVVHELRDAPAESGRGLVLVRELADRWGYELLSSGGKVVWFERRANGS